MLLVVERLVAACSAMSSGPDPQDACRIGAVSPEQYRTLAAEVAAQAPINWDAALDAKYQSEGVAAALRQRLEQVLAGRMSADEQIAAMHAQMRSIGAELRYAQRSADATVAGYRYRLDVNRIGMRRLLSRWAQSHIRFERSPAHDDRPRAQARGGHDAGDARAELAWLEEAGSRTALSASADRRTYVPRTA
jgi:hypothetical protein